MFPAKYYLPIKLNNGTNVIMSTLNGCVIQVNEEVLEKLTKNKLSEFSDEEINCLLSNGFVYKTENEERNIVDKLYNNNTIHVVFITTENCNFRCPYCYETHKNVSIQKETYQAVLNYLRKYSDRSIYINWFGGEPTLNKNDILSFMRELNKLATEKNLSIHSGMTTNGYLLDPESFTEYYNSGITFYQITVDGDRDTHNKSRFLVNHQPTYDTIMNNIMYMHNTDKNFELVLRCNYNEETDLDNYVKTLHKLFGEDNRFTYNLFTVCDWSSNEETPCADVICNPLEESSNIFLQKNKMRNIWSELNGIFAYYCAAAAPNSIVINSANEIMKCTVKLDADYNKVGKLDADGCIQWNNNIEMWNAKIPSSCYECPVFPMCFHQFCPNRKNICRKDYIIDSIKHSLNLKHGSGNNE